SPWSCCQMPEIVLISVLLPAPLSPTSAVTWPTGTSRLMSVRARTGPKFLPTPTRRSSGSSPLLGAVAGASAKAASARPAAISASTAAVSAWAAASSAWTAAVSAAASPVSAGASPPVPGCPAVPGGCGSWASRAWGGWPDSGAGARPAVAGRASSALGLVTGRASYRWARSCSLRYPRGLAQGHVLADAQLRHRHELVRDDGRGHVRRGDPGRLEQHRLHRDVGLGVLRRAVHQAAWRGLAGPHEHGQRHGGLRLQVDRLVDGAALVAGQDVLQPH